jgi:phage I-like protein
LNAPAPDALADLRSDIEQSRAEYQRLVALKAAHDVGIAAMKRQMETVMVEAMIDGYLEKGLILKPEREAALKLARQDPESLKTLLEFRPVFGVMQSVRAGLLDPNNPHNLIGAGKPPKRGMAALNDADRHVAELTGRKAEDFAALKAEYGPDNPFQTR